MLYKKEKMNKKLRELAMCYIEQFGFDVIMGNYKYLGLGTILRLKEIENEIIH